MKVTIDTNIMFQALNSRTGASFKILSLFRAGELQVVLSHAVFLEYQDVLLRKQSLQKFGLLKNDVEAFLRFIACFCEKVDPRFLFRPNLRDEDDNIFVELAVASQSQYLVTSNIRDFKSGDLILDSYRLVTPAEFLEMWRANYE